MIGHSPFRICLASLLALVVMLLCLADPALAVSETLETNAPEECVALSPDQSHAPGLLLMPLDLGDETPDLEQLLQPFENLTDSRQPSAARFPPLLGLRPPYLSPPRLRPPIFLV